WISAPPACGFRPSCQLTTSSFSVPPPDPVSSAAPLDPPIEGVQHPVHEPRALRGSVFLGQQDRLLYGNSRRNVLDVQHLGRSDPQDVAVDDRQALEPPIRQRRVELAVYNVDVLGDGTDQRLQVFPTVPCDPTVLLELPQDRERRGLAAPCLPRIENLKRPTSGATPRTHARIPVVDRDRSSRGRSWRRPSPCCRSCRPPGRVPGPVCRSSRRRTPRGRRSRARPRP